MGNSGSAANSDNEDEETSKVFVMCCNRLFVMLEISFFTKINCAIWIFFLDLKAGKRFQKLLYFISFIYFFMKESIEDVEKDLGKKIIVKFFLNHHNLDCIINQNNSSLKIK